ncbi:Crp/Fnr family transcriptional regulator [Micromonospora sp. SH-82]|uniref:Crp/Fnr family transcriptional regulator n=1 Tax=Micromonospora sp. SH-82 TaxID=3132938 RepID=UPI003EB92A29
MVEIGRRPVRSWPAGTLLSVLGEPDRQDLLAVGTPRRLARGDALIREGDVGDDVFVIVEGCTKVSGDTYDGRTTLLAVRVPGDIVGEFAALDGGRRSATVVACAPTVVRSVGRGAFDSYLATHPAADHAVRRSIVAKLRQATRLRVDAGGSAAEVRLARLLTYLSEVYGRPVAEGRLIDVPLSQAELAAMAGVSVPSVQRAMAVLRRRGLVVPGYRRLVVRGDIDPSAPVPPA